RPQAPGHDLGEVVVSLADLAMNEAQKDTPRMLEAVVEDLAMRGPVEAKQCLRHQRRCRPPRAALAGGRLGLVDETGRLCQASGNLGRASPVIIELGANLTREPERDNTALDQPAGIASEM